MDWLTTSWNASDVREWAKTLIPAMAVLVSLWIASSQARRASASRKRDREEVRKAAMDMALAAYAELKLRQNYKAPRLPIHPFIQAAQALKQFDVRTLPEAELLLSLRTLRACLLSWIERMEPAMRRIHSGFGPDPDMETTVINMEQQIKLLVEKIAGRPVD